MFGVLRRLALASFLASVATSPKSAHAEGAAVNHETPVSTSDATVEIRGSRELPIRLYDPEKRTLRPAPILRCTTPCRALLDRRQYRLVIDKTNTTAPGDRLVR